MPGGKYHFEIAVILRNSYLISSILSCSETWYGVTQAEIKILEHLDESWMRQLFECSQSVPVEMFYLELSVLPVRFIIQIRRTLYL